MEMSDSLDFKARKRGIPTLVLVIAIVASIISVLRFNVLLGEREGLEEIVSDTARQARSARTAGTQIGSSVKSSRADASQADMWIALGTPWETLLRALESSALDGVYVVRLEPNPDQARVEITARASDFELASRYVSKLWLQPALRHVHLVSFTESQEHGTPMTEFKVLAHWNTGLKGAEAAAR